MVFNELRARHPVILASFGAIQLPFLILTIGASVLWDFLLRVWIPLHVGLSVAALVLFPFVRVTANENMQLSKADLAVLCFLFLVGKFSILLLWLAISPTSTIFDYFGVVPAAVSAVELATTMHLAASLRVFVSRRRIAFTGGSRK